jgi:hypothetical protein
VNKTAGQVRRRRVIYIPGYDPIPPRRYRELYRKEGAAQAEISSYDLAIRPRESGGTYGWSVTATIEGAEVEAEVDVLVWSDIVQGSMARSIPATYFLLLRTAWIFISTGALRRLMRLRKGPVIAALYPVGMLIGQLVVAALSGWLVARLAAWTFVQLGLGGMFFGGLSIGLGLLAVVALLRAFKRLDHRLFAYYLMHDYAFSARWRGAHPPVQSARIGEFAAHIASALGDDTDEVLVIGHSSGAHLAISALAQLCREGRLPPERPPLALLTLGQVVPMVSFLPDAHELRADLNLLSASAAITWVDVTAPGDGCAFALCDPVAVSGVAPDNQRWPLVISAAFTQTLSPARWKALRWRFFRLHFQYLCAFDRPGDYDYFRITAGPQTLAQRFDGRPPSKSRILTPTSGYRGMTP